MDHQNLAVIAQIDAPSQRTQERIADGQGGSHLNARRLHGLPISRYDHDVRAQSIGHRPADDLTRGGALQCLNHFESIVIGRPDVKIQMDMILGSINICDHGLDGRVGICQQARAVPPTGSKPLTGCQAGRGGRKSLDWIKLGEFIPGTLVGISVVASTAHRQLTRRRPILVSPRRM